MNFTLIPHYENKNHIRHSMLHYNLDLFQKHLLKKDGMIYINDFTKLLILLNILINRNTFIFIMSTRDRHKEAKKKREKALNSFAAGLLDVEKEDKEAKKEILREGIEEREKIDKSTLKSSRVVTSKLSKIREEAGLSAFVGTSGKIKSPKFRRGEFISFLAREVLLIGRDELKGTGGLISMSKLENHFSETRKNWQLRENDIAEAIKLLVKQDMIPGSEKISDELEIIHFKAIELSKDTRQILQTAMGIEVSKNSLSSILGWPLERVNASIKQLVKDGISVEDGDNVYFPGL